LRSRCELGKDPFDRIEIGLVGRQKDHVSASASDGCGEVNASFILPEQQSALNLVIINCADTASDHVCWGLRLLVHLSFSAFKRSYAGQGRSEDPLDKRAADSSDFSPIGPDPL
jgi:hypothetical protein